MIRRFPIILDMLEDGSVNLTTVGLLASQVTAENHRELLDTARHKSKRQVEELLARLRPQPPVSASVRKLASPAAALPPPVNDTAISVAAINDGQCVAALDLPSPTTAPPRTRPAVITPLAPLRYKVQFTASAETVEKLRLAQDLLRHQIPDGDPAKIFDRALTALLEDLAKKKLAATDRPRGSRGTTPGSRHIPAEVKRVVWNRDGGRCAFVSRTGRRCTEGGFLEFHHVTPYAAGGESTADNIQLRCRAHNRYEAELCFGSPIPARVREERPSYLVPSGQLRPGIVTATRSGPSSASAAPSEWNHNGLGNRVGRRSSLALRLPHQFVVDPATVSAPPAVHVPRPQTP